MYNRYERASRSRVTSPKVLLESKVTKKSIKSKNEEVDNKAPIDVVEPTNTSEVNVQELSPAPKKRRGRRKKSEVTEISPESKVNEGEV